MRKLLGRLTACLLALCPISAHAQGGTTAPYLDAAQLYRVPFGQHSHWAQPWRAYVETIPASAFLSGVGVNMGTYSDANVAKLAAAGVRDARIEVGWGNVNWNETALNDPAGFVAELATFKKYGIRPLILFNWNPGQPCPVKLFSVTLTSPARKGDTSVTVADTSSIVPGLSGLSNLSDYWAAEDVFEKVSGHTATLSKPLPKDIPAGPFACATLKYHPFGVRGTLDYYSTVWGCERYCDLVANAANGVLGKGGWDCEIYNELTFGYHFLYRSDYEPGQPSSDYSGIEADLAAHVKGNPLYAGTMSGDGMANTTPWPAASWVPTDAIDKHPYANRGTYTAGAPDAGGLDALYQPNTWTPGYSMHFPEYYGTVIQTETLLRDASPFYDGSYYYSGMHGRYAGANQVVPVWITEYSLAADPSAVPDEVSKSVLRAYCFYLNKGVTRLDWYNSDGLDASALAGLQRLTTAMSSGLDANANPRWINLLSVSDTHGHSQFRGDGTPAHPTLFDRDVFAFLPYQVNSHHFVVPYYVMTRDVAKDLPAETFTLSLNGFSAPVRVSALDPATGLAVPVTVRQASSDGSLTIDVPTTDSVRLLIFDDAGG